ncbi:hypothetical protein TNCV_4921001 [Trichonephila clavipes]|uniref:Uncharacterized protein n=1 Tax=Trichonephila clavipes TaxID=2585209 RepID=A0A8X6RU52_TRICX|nr:hypothetical protein TNCV_4921001 [Trichonephila clavipes]
MSFLDESIRNVGERDSSKPFSTTSSEHSPHQPKLQLTTGLIPSRNELRGPRPDTIRQSSKACTSNPKVASSNALHLSSIQSHHVSSSLPSPIACGRSGDLEIEH